MWERRSGIVPGFFTEFCCCCCCCCCWRCSIWRRQNERNSLGMRSLTALLPVLIHHHHLLLLLLHQRYHLHRFHLLLSLRYSFTPPKKSRVPSSKRANEKLFLKKKIFIYIYNSVNSVKTDCRARCFVWRVGLERRSIFHFPSQPKRPMA